MKLRVMVAAVALAAGGVVLAGTAPAQAACQSSQSTNLFVANWSANCLTSSTTNKNSNLTLVIQRVLKIRGYTITATDGIFGTETVRAVQAFQRDNRLLADGKVGANTWKALAKQVAWAEDNGTQIIYATNPKTGTQRFADFRVWKSGTNKGRWEVKEHQPGCSTAGDGFAWVDSTRDCG